MSLPGLGILEGKKKNNYLSLWINPNSYVNILEALCTLRPFVK